MWDDTLKLSLNGFLLDLWKKKNRWMWKWIVEWFGVIFSLGGWLELKLIPECS